MEIIFRQSQAKIKKPKHLKKNVFIVYSPRPVKIEPATSTKIDTEIVVLLPKNSKGLITSVFREDEINKFNSEQQRLWVGILNKSYEETLEIKKNNSLGFVVIEPEHLIFKHETTKNKKKKTLLLKTMQYKPKKINRNVEVFLIIMALLMLVETQLIKLLRLPLVLLKLPQTILTTLQNKGSIKSFPKVEQKWKGCFPKY